MELDDETRAKTARRAGWASYAGTTVEWYDFYVYATAAALVLGDLFFPSESQAVSRLAAFASFWVGFIARPVGGAVFGHFGDKFGRKNALITTMLMMGGGTFIIGCLPTFQTIGIYATIILIALRFVQGVAMGGEWGGAVVLAAEHAPKGKGMLYAAFAQQGSPTGNLLATGIWLVIAMLPDEYFYTWGWRIPFLLSAILVFVGLYIRLSVEESPVMQKMIAEQAQKTDKKPSAPLMEIIRKHKLTIFLGMGASVIATSTTYFKGTFALSWVTDHDIFERKTFLSLVTIALIVQLIVQPFGAILANKMSLSRAVTLFLLPEILLMPLMFAVIGTGNYWLSMLVMALATIPPCLYYSMMAGLFSQSFPAQVRYTGISLSYQLSASIFVGTTPLIGQWLLNMTGSIISVIIYSIVQVIFTLVCALGLIYRSRKNPLEHSDEDSFSQPSEGELNR